MAVGDATNYFTKQSGEPVKRFVGQPDGVSYLTQAYTDLYKRRTLTVPVGNYFTPGVFVTTTSLRQTAGEALVWPFFMPEAITISSVSISVASASSAGQTQTLAVYHPAASGTRPGALLANFGTVATDTTGAKSITGLNVTLPQGMLWGYLGSVGTAATAGTVQGMVGVLGSVTPSKSVTSSGPTQIFLGVVPPPSDMTSSSWSSNTGIAPVFTYLRSA